jgi:hypothetical protein
MDKRGEVQVWFSVEIEFVVDELVGCVCGDSVLGKTELWDVFCASVARRVRRHDGLAGCSREFADDAVLPRLGQDFIGVNMLSSVARQFVPCEGPFEFC